MIYNILYSDHIYKWSDNYERIKFILFTEKTGDISQTSTKHKIISDPRFTYRTLQKMWKKGMQVYEWERPWTQILSKLKCLQEQAGCNLCSTGSNNRGEKLSKKLSELSNSSQTNMRYQQRTFTQKRTVLRKRNVYCKGLQRNYRRKSSNYFTCQYASGTNQLQDRKYFS